MSDKEAQVGRFMALFSGREGVMGTFIAKGTDGKKSIGEAKMLERSAIASDYEAHLFDSKCSIGQVPIRDDNTCVFGAIDYDVYDENYAGLLNDIHRNNLSLVPCITKSGGLHLYVFFSEPVPAILVRDLLKKYSSILGVASIITRQGTVSDVEIFPKQNTVTEYTKGSFINLPYHNGTRLALDAQGNTLDLDLFLDIAESKKISRKDVEIFLEPAQGENDPGGTWHGIAACIFPMLKMNDGKIPSGARNDGLMAFATFFRKKYKDHEERDAVVLEYTLKANDQFCSPPLDPDEVKTLVNSNLAKEYNYKCQDLPLQPHCNSTECRKRKFGVGCDEHEETWDFEGLTCVLGEPPTILWTINGREIEFEFEDLVEGNRKRIAHKIFREAKMLTPKKYTYQEISALFSKQWNDRKEVSIGLDGTPKGILFSHLNRYVENNNTEYNNRDEMFSHVRKGSVVIKNRKIYFKMDSFIAYLDSMNFRDYNKTKILGVLKKELKAKPTQGKIYDLSIRCWTIDKDELDRVMLSMGPQEISL